MKPSRVFLFGAAFTTALAAALAVSTLAAPAGTAVTRRAARLPHAQHLTLTIVGRATDERLLPAAGNFAIAAGVLVRVTVTNYTPEYHSFTIPKLGVSALIAPARGHKPSKTMFAFTASKTGAFAWHCVFCVGGNHGMAHDMGGTVYAIIDPSALP